MKKILLLLLNLFTLSLNAHSRGDFQPISEFNEGMYLGRGEYRDQDGNAECYSSYAVFFPNDWELLYLSSRGVHAYSLHFDFSANQNGFFDVQLTEHMRHDAKSVNNLQDNLHQGKGNCGSSQCSYVVQIGNDIINETISFNLLNSSIDRLGNIHMFSDNGEATVVMWEEQMKRIDMGAEI